MGTIMMMKSIFMQIMKSMMLIKRTLMKEHLGADLPKSSGSLTSGHYEDLQHNNYQYIPNIGCLFKIFPSKGWALLNLI